MNSYMQNMTESHKKIQLAMSEHIKKLVVDYESISVLGLPTKNSFSSKSS